jgi:threonine dehydratase
MVRGIAYAGKTFGIPTTIVVPENTPRVKLTAIQALGGRLFYFGRNFDQAATQTREVAERTGMLCIEDGADSDLMAGLGRSHGKSSQICPMYRPLSYLAAAVI